MKPERWKIEYHVCAGEDQFAETVGWHDNEKAASEEAARLCKETQKIHCVVEASYYSTDYTVVSTFEAGK